MRPIQRTSWYALMLVFAGACAYALRADLGQLSFVPLAKAWDIVLLATLLSLLNYGARIARWRSYLARLGHSMSFGFTALTYTAGFAFTLSPGKVGEMVRARYYAPLGVPLAHVAAAFFVERLLDLLAMLVLAMLILTISDRYEIAMWGAAIAISTALVLLTVMPWTRVERTVRDSSRVPKAIRGTLAGAAHALASARVLLTPRALVTGFLIGLVAWGLEGLGLGLLGSMFAPSHLDTLAAVGIYAIAILAGALSFLPGGLGSTEAIMAALLVTQGYPLPQALLITLTCRLVTLWLAVAVGWGAVFALRRDKPAMV